MRLGGGFASAVVVFLSIGVARPNSISVDIHLSSGISASVTLAAANGSLPAATAMTLALSNGVTAGYDVQYRLGDLGAPDTTAPPPGSVFGDVVFQNGPIHVWPVAPSENGALGAGSPSDLFSRFQELMAASHVGGGNNPAQYLLATLTPSNLGLTPAPSLALAFIRPSDSPDAPFSYLTSLEAISVPAPDDVEYFVSDPPMDAPEPSTIALFSLGLAGIAISRKRRPGGHGQA